MARKSLFLVALVLTAGQMISCQRSSFDPNTASTFFPLRSSLIWTYRVIDSRQGTTTTFTDRVVGQTQMGARGIGEVETEYSGPTGVLGTTMRYVPQNGYFNRQFGEENSRLLFVEQAFLPQQLKPDLTWSNSLVPFKDQPGAFHVTQLHHTFFERKEMVVPAGRYDGCIRIETDALYQGDSPQVEPPLRLEYLDWYAPRVGLVKTLVKESGFFGSELVRVELLNFGHQQPSVAASTTNSAAALRGSARKSSFLQNAR